MWWSSAIQRDERRARRYSHGAELTYELNDEHGGNGDDHDGEVGDEVESAASSLENKGALVKYTENKSVVGHSRLQEQTHTP